MKSKPQNLAMRLVNGATMPDIGSLFVNPPETAPKNEYVTLHGYQGERVTGMQMADGRWLVRDGDRVGAMGGDGIAGWSERE